ncbi:GNAT family N-acetyltransferase [uncultured Jatrophihabitans sp.]|uniref:GNAT family N-acetyltransferase n=1 Tax=uncultured Jatrophihabitans sp. TaxID=1610747 RepID=UPI0035CC7D7B
MADVSVRTATEADAQQLGRIQVDTWRLAYAQVLPEPVLSGLTPDLAAGQWASAITAPPSAQHHVLVALEQQWLVGFAASGPVVDVEPDDPPADTTSELALVLVEPRWGRRGHGSRLLAATVDHARADGMTRGVCWIPEQDEVTREFLVSAGWAPDGLARALDTGAGELRQIRLQTSFVDEG